MALRNKNIDTLLLGCTHYPLLEHTIKDIMGPDVQLVNPAKAFAHKMQKIPLAKENAFDLSFFVSDDPSRFKAIGEAFLGMPMNSVERITFS